MSRERDDVEPLHAQRRRRSGFATWVSVAAVVLLVLTVGAVSLFSGGGRPAASPSTTVSISSTPSPTATPSPLPAIALDRDCSRLLTDPAALGVAGPLSTPKSQPAFLLLSDPAPSLALLGGFLCAGTTTDGADVTVAVLPGEVVPTSLRDRWSSGFCSMVLVCEVGVAVGDFWLAVAESVPDGDWEGVAAYEAEVLKLARAIGSQAEPLLSGASSRPIPPQPDWWTKGACPSLTPVVEAAVGAPLTPGFQGDSVPEGIVWEVSLDAAGQDWCPWNGWVHDAGVMVEVFIMPGVGAPTAEQLADSREVIVAHADRAWMRPNNEGYLFVVAVVGPNRLLVKTHTSDETEAVVMVSALIDQVNAVRG